MENNKAVKRHSKKAGLPPGTLIHIGKQKSESVQITVIDYDERTFTERTVDNIEEVFGYKDTSTVTWINIDGLHRVDIIERVGEHFGLHPLVLEDILNTEQRPKLEDYENNLFVVMKMLSYKQELQDIDSEQVSVILGGNYVISFQEKIGDVFKPIRERIQNAKGKIRKMRADYLAYSLLDSVVDNYFLVLEKLGDQIESLQEELFRDTGQTTIENIHKLKRKLISLRKNIWPLRELINNLDRIDSPLIAPATKPYMKDVYDHTIHIIDTLETYRDMVGGILDIYLSNISNKMNSVMKVLTIIATIFIPLTFIAGVYGMNFKHMPELEWKYGYLGIWVVMIAVIIMMLWLFKRNKWI